MIIRARLSCAQEGKQKFVGLLDAPKAFSLRRRWQPEGLTDEVVCDSTDSPKPLIFIRFFLLHTSSVAYGDSFSSRRSLWCNAVFRSTISSINIYLTVVPRAIDNRPYGVYRGAANSSINRNLPNSLPAPKTPLLKGVGSPF